MVGRDDFLQINVAAKLGVSFTGPKLKPAGRTGAAPTTAAKRVASVQPAPSSARAVARSLASRRLDVDDESRKHHRRLDGTDLAVLRVINVVLQLGGVEKPRNDDPLAAAVHVAAGRE